MKILIELRMKILIERMKILIELQDSCGAGFGWFWLECHYDYIKCKGEKL